MLGPETDIPAPDVNTDGRVMAWLMDTLSMVQGRMLPGSVTGKPLSIGGTRNHSGATSAGCLDLRPGGAARARASRWSVVAPCCRGSARSAARWRSCSRQPACGSSR